MNCRTMCEGATNKIRGRSWPLALDGTTNRENDWDSRERTEAIGSAAAPGSLPRRTRLGVDPLSCLAPGTRHFVARVTPQLILTTAEGHGTLEASINALLIRYETPQQRVRGHALESPAFARLSVRAPAWVAILDALGLRPS